MEKLNFKLPEQVGPVALALGLGGVLFIVAEAILKRRTRIAQITWTVVLAVAIAQLIAAIFPGRRARA